MEAAKMLRSTLDVDRNCARIFIPPGLAAAPGTPVRVQAPEILGMASFPVVLPPAAYQHGGVVEVALQYVPRLPCSPSPARSGTSSISSEETCGNFAPAAETSCLFMPSMLANIVGPPRMAKAPDLPPSRRIVPCLELPEELRDAGPLERHKYEMILDHGRKCRARVPPRQRRQAPPVCQSGPNNLSVSLLNGGLSRRGSDGAEFKKRKIEYAEYCGRMLLQRMPPQALGSILAADEIEEAFQENEEFREVLAQIDELFESGALVLAQDARLSEYEEQQHNLEVELANCRQELAEHMARPVEVCNCQELRAHCDLEIALARKERQELEFELARCKEELAAQQQSFDQFRSESDAETAALRNQRDTLETDLASNREELEVMMCQSLEGAAAKDMVMDLRSQVNSLEATCAQQKQELARLLARPVEPPPEAAKPRIRAIQAPIAQPNRSSPCNHDELLGSQGPSSGSYPMPSGRGTPSTASGQGSSQASRAPSLASTHDGLAHMQPRPPLHPISQSQQNSLYDNNSRSLFGYGTSSPSNRCACGIALQKFETRVHNFLCNGCQKRFGLGMTMYGCRACDFDLCENCYVTPRMLVPHVPKHPGNAGQYGSSMPRACCGHELQMFAAPYPNSSCKSCQKPVTQGATLYGCRTCDIDQCECCYFASKAVLPQGAAESTTASSLINGLPRCDVFVASSGTTYESTYSTGLVRATAV